MSGLALAIGALAAVWFLSSAQLTLLAAAVAALAVFEYARIARGLGADPPLAPALLATLAVVVAVTQAVAWVPWLLSATLLVAALVSMLGGRHGTALVHGTLAAALAPVYIGLPLGALVGVHQLAGREAVLVLIATVAVSDSAQYYTGRAFGRRPLAPAISPKKTIEGALGGLVLAPLALVAIAGVWFPAWPPAAVAGLGVGLAVAGICGDLFESALKRAADMKDSGALIPGHGGVLDRIDALLFAAPLFYVFLLAL